MNKLQKLPPAWHAEAKQLLAENFARIHSQLLDSTKRALWLGLFLTHIKFRGDKRTGDGSIPHGEFGPWLEKNLPEISWRSANVYMHLARNVCEKGRFEIRSFCEFGDARHFQLPPPLEKIVEGKTQYQLFSECKQVEERDGELVVKRGRRRGEGGREAEPAGSILENLEFHKKYSVRHLGIADRELEKVGLRWMAMPDDLIAAFVARNERQITCMNRWLNMPPGKRDEKEFHNLFYKKL